MQVSPNPTTTNASTMKCIAEVVEGVLNQHCLHDKQPRQIEPQKILVAPSNRDGTPPNAQHVHSTILKSFATQGFSKGRPQPGICIKYTTEEGKAKLIEHNKQFSIGNSLLPPIEENQSEMYGSIASSHLNIALRLLRNNASSPACDLSKVMVGNGESASSLRDTVQHGHKWLVLPEGLPFEDYTKVSQWRNQDQQENLAAHEIEILGGIIAAATDLAKNNKKVLITELVIKAQKRTPQRLSASALHTIAKFYCLHLDGLTHLVSELIDFHSQKVNPGDLQISITFINLITIEKSLAQAPLVRLYLFLTQYTLQGSRSTTGGGPATAGFLDQVTLVNGIFKKTTLINTLEKHFASLRNEILPLLECAMSPKLARIELAGLMILIIRSVLAKGAPPSLDVKIPSTKAGWSEEKGSIIRKIWMRQMDANYPTLHLNPDDDPEEEKDDREVNLNGLRSLKEHPSAASDELLQQYKLNDQVTVITKVTWAISHPTKPNYRKDINVGSSGIIKGFADSQGRQVLLCIDVSIPGHGSQEVTHAIFPRHLMLTSEYEERLRSEEAAEEEEEQAGEEEEEPDVPKEYDFLIKEGESSKITIQHQWPSLLADADDLIKASWVKARIGVFLSVLHQTLPSYDTSDLIICQRANDKGIWRTEVWTAREFAPGDLMLAPYTSQMKDTHLTSFAHVQVGLPKCGWGASKLEGVALDGRSRNSIQAKDSLGDGIEKTGSLFWMVQRTTEKTEANLFQEPLTIKGNFAVGGGSKKLKLTLEWDSANMPTIPILSNKKVLKEHVQLVAFEVPKIDPKASASGAAKASGAAGKASGAAASSGGEKPAAPGSGKTASRKAASGR